MSALLRVNAKVKIIVVTGFVTDAQKEAAMAAGASEFLAKPFTIEKLLVDAQNGFTLNRRSLDRRLSVGREKNAAQSTAVGG